MTEAPVSVEHDPAAGVYRAEFDPAETRPVRAVLALLTEIETAEGIDLRPLYDIVDPEPLGRLLRGWHRRQPTERLDVAFETGRVRIAVECRDATVTIEGQPLEHGK